MLPCLSWELSSRRFSLHHRYRLLRVEVDEQPVVNRKEKKWRMNVNAVNYSYKDAQARFPFKPQSSVNYTNNTMPINIFPPPKKRKM